MTTVIPVRTERPYDVVVGRDVLLPQIAEAVADAAQVLVVHQPAMARQADAIKSALGDHVLLAEVPDAEAAKRIEVAQFLWQIMGQADFTRTDMVVGLGGGAVTDLAGFVAATWLRGVPVVLAPSSVLGMVDAAVGGKTGINTEQGKNLVGAFHHPARVVCDLALLDTLPRNELLTGFAEIVKAGFIADPAILTLLEEHLDARATRRPCDGAVLDRAVELAQQQPTVDLPAEVGSEAPEARRHLDLEPRRREAEDRDRDPAPRLADRLRARVGEGE